MNSKVLDKKEKLKIIKEREIVLKRAGLSGMGLEKIGLGRKKKSKRERIRCRMLKA